jgi:hypothetical protein
VVDFCSRMNWELIDNCLYFVQSDIVNSDNSNNTVVSSAETFVNEILPTLISKTTSSRQSLLQASI